MEFWTRGEAPTLAEFARAWSKAKANEYLLLTAEYAYLRAEPGECRIMAR